MTEETEEKKVKKTCARKTKGFGLLETIIIIVVTSIIAAITTGVILYNSFGEKTGVSYGKLSEDKNLKEFLDVYYSLSEEYYENIDKEEMLESAIKGMTDYLGDSYTTYLSEEETKQLEETLIGKYKGIGISFSNRTVASVFKNSPAERAGILPGDKFVSVNGNDCTELTDTEISNLIKSNDKSAVVVMNRDGKESSYTIELNSLNVPAISYSITEDKIGYIYISTFSSTLAEQVQEALIDLESQSMKSLIIDVRDNAGGYLVAASGVANLFLEKGKTIYSLQSNDILQIYKDETEEKRDYKILVLINKNSASAAEILAASLKESYGATLLGEKSYGKGKVQQTKELSDGRMVKYTTAKWLTPTGVCIDQLGLEPDIAVEQELIYTNGEVTGIKDTQLKEAIKYMQK